MNEALRSLLAVLILYSPSVQARSAEDATRERVRRAQTALASSLDPALPSIPLDAWIRQVLGTTARYEWDSGFCEGTRERLNSALPVCVVAVATLSETTVTISVRLGERVSGNAPDRWDAPRLEDASIHHGGYSLTLDRLGKLPRMLDVPAETWPKPELALEDDVQCSPGDSAAFQHTTCTVSVVNVGDAPGRARVFLELQPDYVGAASGSEHVITILPGMRRTISWTFDWPDGSARAVGAGVELLTRTDDRRPVVTEQAFQDSQLIKADIQTILSVRGALTQTGRSFDVPVDSSISRLVISVDLDARLSPALLTPGDSPVTAFDPGVSIGSLWKVNSGMGLTGRRWVYTVIAPQSGVWRLEVSGGTDSDGSNISLLVRGDSPIALGDFRFVRKWEGVHGGYFPIDGMPVVGREATGEAHVWHGPSIVTFRSVNESGRTIQTLAFTDDDPLAKPSFVGTVPLPSVPFSIVMNATDALGTPIQRQYPLIFQAQTVEVSFNYAPPTVIARGTTRKLTFTVKNVGIMSATFRLDAKTSLGELRDVSPWPITIEPGGSAAAAFSIAVPPDASEGRSINVRMTATNLADSRLTNSASAEMEVAGGGDADGDFVPDANDNCPKFPNDQTDLDRNGIGDACDPAHPMLLQSRPLTGPAPLPIVVDGYSAPGAVIGSTRVARRAGR